MNTKKTKVLKSFIGLTLKECDRKSLYELPENLQTEFANYFYRKYGTTFSRTSLPIYETIITEEDIRAIKDIAIKLGF